jgi:valine dehydrogenase (NAD+)
MGVFSPKDGIHGESAGAHEQVVFCQDERSGLRAIIAIYSTALGPALGGTRFHQYASEEAALHDALELSRAMAYKNALAGLDLGGGKAVIWGDPGVDKSEALLRAYGRFIDSLGGRYVTACDVGTYVTDMDVIARETRFVTGRSPEHGGAGDSSVLTAYGVYEAMRAAAAHRWGTPSLSGRRVAIAGVGKVGRHLADRLAEAGACLVLADVNRAAIETVLAQHPDAEVMDPEALVRAAVDVYAPCALGGALNDDTVAVLQAEIVCGGANNQLAHPGVDKLLADRGILYTPDYVANSGGVIQVADEIEGFVFERARRRASGIHETVLAVFRRAESDGTTPATAADRLAELRMSQVGRLRSILVPTSR